MGGVIYKNKTQNNILLYYTFQNGIGTMNTLKWSHCQRVAAWLAI